MCRIALQIIHWSVNFGKHFITFNDEVECSHSILGKGKDKSIRYVSDELQNIIFRNNRVKFLRALIFFS